MKDYTERNDLPIQIDFAGDEICQKMTANVDLWETYIKVTCFLISNVARIEDFLVLFPLVKEYPVAWMCVHTHFSFLTYIFSFDEMMFTLSS